MAYSTLMSRTIVLPHLNQSILKHGLRSVLHMKNARMAKQRML